METREFKETALRVSNVSIVVNVLLTVFKLLAGFFGHSGAMISDAVHSASDVLSGFIVIIGVRISAKDSDKNHPYGHERFECAAAIILAVILCITGIFIGHTAIEKLTGHAANADEVPEVIALVAAIVSIVVKEAMYWYTIRYANQFNSAALKGEAWHHRSDAFSSIGSLIGIAGARMGYVWLDSVASLVICVFIMKAAVDIFVEAMKKLVDHSCDEEMEEKLKKCALTQKGVTGVKSIMSREFGNRIYLNLDVTADGNLTLLEANRIQENVHKAIEQNYPEVKHVFVRVLPEE